MSPEGTQGTNSETPIPKPRPTIGQPFNPWRKACGFYPPDIVGCNTELELTDGQKRLYERGVRWAGRKGVFWYGFDAIAKALGKSVRQVKADMATLEEKGLMDHSRRRRQSNLYRFLWHPIFEVQSTALQEEDLEVQESALAVQDGVILKVQPTAQELCKSELRTLNSAKSNCEADYSPRIEKHDARSVGGPLDAEKPRANGRQADDPSAKTAAKGCVSVPRAKKPRPQPKPKPTAFHGDWEEDDFDATSEFLCEHPPEDTEEWPGGRIADDPPEWLIERLLDAGLGAPRCEVLTFLESKISSGWNPPNWRSYLAVVRGEFERRQNRAQGAHWSDSDLASVRAVLKTYMEDDDPPVRFEHSCELRANSATAREVVDLIERRFKNQKYRPGAVSGPRSWNWFLTVIGNEFSETERNHLPEPPAEPRLEHRTDPDALAHGIEALDSIAVSVLCSRCGCSVIQYADGSFKGCKCGGSDSRSKRKQMGRFQLGNPSVGKREAGGIG